jgi:hypothetical protein
VVFSGYSGFLHNITEILLKVALLIFSERAGTPPRMKWRGRRIVTLG